jgi:hypothetical protein
LQVFAFTTVKRIWTGSPGFPSRMSRS